MRFRAAHLACLLVLLTAFGAADAATRSSSGRDGSAFRVLLGQTGAISAGSESAPAASRSARTHSVLPSAERTQATLPWTMHPPAAHTIAQHATSGSGL